MKKILYIALILVIPISFMAQTDDSNSFLDFNPGVAVGVSGSTNGLGVSVITAINNRVALRLSYEALNKSFSDDAFTYEVDDRSFNVGPSITTGGLSAILDFYVLKGLYLSAGVVSTAADVSAKIMSAGPMKVGDITYTPEEMGELHLSILPENKVAPYVAVGFGRNISRDDRLAMSFEVGSYFMKSYVVALSGTNFFESNNVNTSLEDLNQTLRDTSWSGLYPVLKLGISYKLYGNKK